MGKFITIVQVSFESLPSSILDDGETDPTVKSRKDYHRVSSVSLSKVSTPRDVEGNGNIVHFATIVEYSVTLPNGIGDDLGVESKFFPDFMVGPFVEVVSAVGRFSFPHDKLTDLPISVFKLGEPLSLNVCGRQEVELESFLDFDHSGRLSQC